MVEKLSDGFYLITQSAILKQAIDFLQKNFLWSNEKSTKIYERLISQDKNQPFGAVYIEEFKIVSAVLLFHQGRSEIEKKEVINLSSWYALQSHRGVHAVAFAKELIKALDDRIITDYTPSDAACKIFTSLNFRNMNIDKHEIGISNKFPFLSILPIFKLLGLNGIKILSLKEEKSLNDKTKKICFFSVNSFKKYNIKISVLNIYVKEENVKINIIQILKLIIKYRTIKINLFYKKDIANNKNIWLIKNQKKENFIIPLRSELSL